MNPILKKIGVLGGLITLGAFLIILALHQKNQESKKKILLHTIEYEGLNYNRVEVYRMILKLSDIFTHESKLDRSIHTREVIIDVRDDIMKEYPQFFDWNKSTSWIFYSSNTQVQINGPYTELGMPIETVDLDILDSLYAFVKFNKAYEEENQIYAKIRVLQQTFSDHIFHRQHIVYVRNEIMSYYADAFSLEKKTIWKAQNEQYIFIGPFDTQNRSIIKQNASP